MMTIRFGLDFELMFALEPTPLAELWQEKMHQRHQWPLDDAKRFYNFDSEDLARQKATDKLLQCIQIINDHEPIIDRQFTSIDDQDLLNYLHNIFERYHGLLDQQNTDWWAQAPVPVRRALAELNIAVHRAESASRNGRPRIVCTWFGMPKNSELDPDLIQRWGRMNVEFGGVYLNYVEIGKTLEDLSQDDDQWISHDAFQPFRHYSADFNIRFYDADIDADRISRYFDLHKEFFRSRDIHRWDDWRVKPVRFKVAQLITDHSHEFILENLAINQEITDIYLP